MTPCGVKVGGCTGIVFGPGRHGLFGAHSGVSESAIATIDSEEAANRAEPLEVAGRCFSSLDKPLAAAGDIEGGLPRHLVQRNSWTLPVNLAALTLHHPLHRGKVIVNYALGLGVKHPSHIALLAALAVLVFDLLAHRPPRVSCRPDGVRLQ